MKFLWPAVLQILAFGVAFAEVMIPSFGLLTLLCAGLAIYSWFYIVTELPRGAILGFAVADLILVPVAVKLGFSFLGRSPVSHRMDLGTGSGLEEQDRILEGYVGQTGVVDAPLRPIGKIRIGADVFEAQTAGDFANRGDKVRVTGLAPGGFRVEKL